MAIRLKAVGERSEVLAFNSGKNLRSRFSGDFRSLAVLERRGRGRFSGLEHQRIRWVMHYQSDDSVDDSIIFWQKKEEE